MNFDLAIIGGGPAGYNVAERAALSGLKTVLFEKKAVGGVCLNEGCIPTKTMLYSAKLLDNAKSATKYGILGTENASFDLGKIIARKNKTVRKLTAGVKMKLKESGVSVVEQEAAILGENNEAISIKAADDTFEASYVIVGTAS